MRPMAEREATLRWAIEADSPALSEVRPRATAAPAAHLLGRFREPAGDARPRESVAAAPAVPAAALFVADTSKGPHVRPDDRSAVHPGL
jgi:hypothetical protein